METISRRHGCSVAAVVLQWDIQRGVTVIPASLKQHELEENIMIMPIHGAGSANTLGRSRRALIVLTCGVLVSGSLLLAADRRSGTL